MASLTPTQRTLAAQRNMGRLCAICEKYLKYPGMKFGVHKDLFGILDIIALDPGGDGIVGIQSCGTNFSEHFMEMTTSTDTYKDTGLTKPEACIEWLKAGGRLELYGWRKIKQKRGGKRMVWAPRIHVFTLGDFE